MFFLLLSFVLLDYLHRGFFLFSRLNFSLIFRSLFIILFVLGYLFNCFFLRLLLNLVLLHCLTSLILNELGLFFRSLADLLFLLC
jgi:hypothetical protein